MDEYYDITAEVYSPSHELIQRGNVKDFSWGNGGIVWLEFEDETKYYTGANNIVVKKSKHK